MSSTLGTLPHLPPVTAVTGTDRPSLDAHGPPTVGAVDNRDRGARLPDLAAGPDHPRASRARRSSAPTAASPGYAARRSPCSPASAPTTTRASSAGTSPASPSPCWRRSRPPSSSTRPNAPTCSTSPTPRTPAAAGGVAPREQHLRPGVQRVLDTIGAPAYVRNYRFDLLGVNRTRTRPVHRPLRRRDAANRTSRATSSWTPDPRTSTSNGQPSPATPSRRSASRRAATPTTAASPTSSVSSPRAARSSGPGGPATT